MAGLQVHYSSNTIEWATPPDLFQRLDREFGFTLDPCSTADNAKCARHYTKAENGLLQDWSNDVVFMNPPYGRAIGAWIAKAHEESKRGAIVVCLIPARTDTAYWHDHVMQADEVRLLRGRLRFGGAKAAAPFPSAIVIFGTRARRDRAWFSFTPWPIVTGATV